LSLDKLNLCDLEDIISHRRALLSAGLAGDKDLSFLVGNRGGEERRSMGVHVRALTSFCFPRSARTRRRMPERRDCRWMSVWGRLDIPSISSRRLFQPVRLVELHIHVSFPCRCMHFLYNFVCCRDCSTKYAHAFGAWPAIDKRSSRALPPERLHSCFRRAG
jgi:hypothetical protein